MRPLTRARCSTDIIQTPIVFLRRVRDVRVGAIQWRAFTACLKARKDKLTRWNLTICTGQINLCLQQFQAPIICHIPPEGVDRVYRSTDEPIEIQTCGDNLRRSQRTTDETPQTIVDSACYYQQPCEVQMCFSWQLKKI